jgi:hypothetical protein
LEQNRVLRQPAPEALLYFVDPQATGGYGFGSLNDGPQV